jgi:hypothetical protein
VEQKNCLGIYLSKDSATVAQVSSSSRTVTKHFTVSANGDGEPSSLAAAISKQIAERNIKFTDVAIAADCAMYIQHDLHSEFSDYKQIAQTINFDAEEAVAADAMDLAITFNITGTDPYGSTLTVFTARRDELTDALNDLQQYNLDPLFIEPDIAPLTRLIADKHKLEEGQNPLFAIFSATACYLLCLEPTRHGFFPIVRSFLVGPSQDKTALLTRQLTMTRAALSSKYPDQPITSLMIAGDSDDIDTDSLAERTGLEIGHFSLADLIGAEETDESTDVTALTAACAAALTEITRATPNDFRKDFSPFQGRKRIMEKTLRTIAVSLTILMIAVGIHFEIKSMQKKNAIKQLVAKSSEDYKAVMFGKAPPPVEPIHARLKREYNKLQRIKTGQSVGDEKSVTAKLTFIFEAINKAPKNIDLKINTISVTSKTMRIIGDTNSRKSRLALFKAIEDHPKLTKGQESFKQSGNRDAFTLTIEPAK